MILFLILGIIVGAVLGLIRAILGETIFYSLSTLLGLYLAYMYFSIFGLMWGIIIIVAFVLFLLVGVYENIKDVGSTILGRK